MTQSTYKNTTFEDMLKDIIRETHDISDDGIYHMHISESGERGTLYTGSILIEYILESAFNYVSEGSDAALLRALISYCEDGSKAFYILDADDAAVWECDEEDEEAVEHRLEQAELYAALLREQGKEEEAKAWEAKYKAW